MVKSGATIVLVHGAWADGSSWNKVIPLLLAKNMQVIAVQLPLTSVEDDLVATNRVIADTEKPIVLVGHSWGGMAVTQAGNDPKVMALVILAVGRLLPVFPRKRTSSGPVGMAQKRQHATS